MKYIKTIEDILQTELTEKNLKNYHINPYQLQELHFALKEYYKTFKLPEKNEEKLRPYLSPRYAFGKNASMSYTAMKFDLEDPAYVLERSIKRTLLYSHEVCVQDPLTYLLDYFYEEPENEHAERRIPIISHIFSELARMKPLIERGVLYIVSDEVFPGLNNFKLITENRDLENAIEAKLGKENFNSYDFHQIIQSVYEQVVLNDDIDLYFPSWDYRDLYKTLMDVNREQYTSKKLDTPSNFGIIGGLQEIDTDKVRLEDIITMREHENVFEDWRLLLGETFKEMKNNSSSFTDANREFSNLINEQTRKFNSDILKKAQQDTFYSNLPKSKEKVFAGFASNFLLNASMPQALIPSEGSFINTMLSTFLELMINKLTDQKGLKLKNAVTNHFLCIR